MNVVCGVCKNENWTYVKQEQPWFQQKTQYCRNLLLIRLTSSTQKRSYRNTSLSTIDTFETGNFYKVISLHNQFLLSVHFYGRFWRRGCSDIYIIFGHISYLHLQLCLLSPQWEHSAVEEYIELILLDSEAQSLCWCCINNISW